MAIDPTTGLDSSTGMAPGQVPYSPYPGGQETLGGSMFPWLQQYQGNYVAGPSNQQQQSYGQTQNMINSGSGMSPSQTSFNVQPMMNQIQNNAQTLKDYEDQQALRRIASSSAAGGNALSGARMQAEGDYSRNSDASFNQMMGNLGLQSGLSNRGMSIQENLGNNNALNTQYGQQLGAQNNLMNQYNTQQGIQNQGLGMQYADFLRQTQNMNTAYNYPDVLANQMLHAGYPGSSNPQYGNSTLDQILAGLGSSGLTGQNGALSNLLKGLLGGGNQQKPSTGSGAGPGAGGAGGGKPGQDASGNKPTDPNYDSTTDPGSPDYIQPGTDAVQDPNTGQWYDPNTGALMYPDGNGGYSTTDYGNPDMGYGNYGPTDPTQGYDPNANYDYSNYDMSNNYDYSGDNSGG